MTRLLKNVTLVLRSDGAAVFTGDSLQSCQVHSTLHDFEWYVGWVGEEFCIEGQEGWSVKGKKSGFSKLMSFVKSSLMSDTKYYSMTSINLNIKEKLNQGKLITCGFSRLPVAD